MRQTWHIFLKDARRLRYDIILIGALTAVYVWLQGHVWTFDTLQIGKLKGAAGILRVFLLPMAWWVFGLACRLWRADTWRSAVLGYQALPLDQPTRGQAALHDRLCEFPPYARRLFYPDAERISALGESCGPALAPPRGLCRISPAHDRGGLASPPASNERYWWVW